jgi:aliphatic aldoxime dehydratase
MESAIDVHLKCPRTRTRRVGDDFQPPYPAFSARAPQTMTQVVMGYFGVQSRGGGEAMETAFKAVNALFDLPDGPDHRDTVRYIDGDGYDTVITVAYWGDTKQFSRWIDNPPNQAWWNADERLRDGVGYFREILNPRDAQYETAYSSPKHLEGVGVVMGGVSGEILEHGYWGSMRDRIPLSQTDTMSPTGALRVRDDGNGRVTVHGHENLAVIRSGQDWTDTQGEERRAYLEDIEPTLRAGMDFLRDQGAEVGCYSNRYVQHIDADGRPVEKSFGISHWHSLADLERWAESHPTHLKIFGIFLKKVSELPNLRLYHEVSVLDAAAQRYEYINCHPGTGLLRPGA